MAGGRTFPGATRQRGSAWQRRGAALLRVLVLLLAWFGSATAYAAETAADTSTGEHISPGDAPHVPHELRSLPPPPEGYNTHEGGWVTFAYHPSVIDKVQPLIQEAEAFKLELQQRLGQSVLQHVDVR